MDDLKNYIGVKMIKAKKKEAWLRKMAIVALDQHARMARAQHISEKDFVSAPNIRSARFSRK